MGITVIWDNEDKTAICIVYRQPWTWQDFDAAVKQMLTLLDSMSHKVDIIFDIREGGTPPAGAMLRFKRVATINHPNGGKLIFVSSRFLTVLIEGIISVLAKAFSGVWQAPDFSFVSTLEEARRLLREQRQIPGKGEEAINHK
jgi:hypothetical protein